MAVLAEHSSDGAAQPAVPGRRGSATRATRPSEGEAGHNVLPEGNTEDTLRSQPVSTKLRRIAERAAQNPDLVFTALAHLIDVAWLREAYRVDPQRRVHWDRRGNGGGICRQPRCERGRLRSQRYTAPPVKRAWIEKDDGSKRPLGKPCFEDKIVQRAVAMLLSAIYEQDVHGGSYGFRPGRSPHQAFAALREGCWAENVNWIVDADVIGCETESDARRLMAVLPKRFERFKLAIHPVKTRLVEFGKPGLPGSSRGVRTHSIFSDLRTTGTDRARETGSSNGKRRTSG